LFYSNAHFLTLNIEASKTKQDGGSVSFIDKYFVYEVFSQEKLFGMKGYILFWCFKLRCLLPIEGYKTPGLHYDLIEVILNTIL
jgi:hypothetical protein